MEGDRSGLEVGRAQQTPGSGRMQGARQEVRQGQEVRLGKVGQFLLWKPA